MSAGIKITSVVIAEVETVEFSLFPRGEFLRYTLETAQVEVESQPCLWLKVALGLRVALGCHMR